MSGRRNVALLFSKLPVAGQVKTRLTTQRGGALTARSAASLYHCMLLDVIHAVLDAFEELEAEADRQEGPLDAYELVVSTTPAPDVPRMRELLARAGLGHSAVRVIADTGADLVERSDHAFGQCFDAGADCVLSMRCDLPALTKDIVHRGFEMLHALDGRTGGGIVLAPCQRAGVSLIGWTRETRFSHAEALASRDAYGGLSAYVHGAAARGLPVLLLPTVEDLDTMDDLYHSATLVQALGYSAGFSDAGAPWRTAAALYRMGMRDIMMSPAPTDVSQAPSGRPDGDTADEPRLK